MNMVNFKLIFQILSMMDKYLDYEDPDWSKLSAENFKVTETRFTNIMIMLYESGYIAGVDVIPLMNGHYDIKLLEPRITLKDLEYLEENTNMKKAYRMIKGLSEIIPRL